MLEHEIKDNLCFIDEKTGDVIVFNYYTFCQIIVGCIVHYAGLSADKAFDRLIKSTIIAKPPATYSDVAFLTHEYEYHWAMTLAYGEEYWLGDPGVSSELPADYDEWEQEYIARNKLADSSYEYQE